MLHIGMTEAMIFIEDEIWTVPAKSNVLLAINVKNGKTRYIAKISDSKKYRLYSDIVRYDDNLYFIPLSADKITIFELNTGKVRNIEFEFPMEYEGKTRYLDDYKFCKGYVYDDKLYLFGCTYPAILRIDLKDECVTYIKGWVENVEDRTINSRVGYFRGWLLHDNKMFFPSASSSCVLMFDFLDEKVRIIEIGNESYSDIIYWKEFFYISTFESGKLLRVKDLLHHEDIVCVNTAMPSYTIKLYANDSKMFIIPFELEKFCIWDENRKMRLLDIESDFIFGVIAHDGYIYFVGDNNPNLLRINLADDSDIQKINMIFDEKIKKYLYGEYFEGSNVIPEELMGLNDFIKCFI